MLAFILVKIESGKDREIVSRIIDLGIKKVYPTYGVYDLVMEIEFTKAKELDDFVFNKIRRIKGVTETVTMIVSEMLMWEMGLSSNT